MTMSENSDEARTRAEAQFAKKEQQQREASKAMSEYRAGQQAERDKTERLRAERLAREASAAAAAEAAAAKKAAGTKKPRAR
jgi:hypothetical protein